jgi:hypothetical protein
VDTSRAIQVSRDYVLTRFRTVERFDFHAGTWSAVNSELIRSTWFLSSRISKQEEKWFIQTAETAPWGAVPLGSSLIDADPTERGGLYDEAERLWYHFADAAIQGVARGKISKVLHAMRPSFFPILDSQLVTKFRESAGQAAVRLRDVRPTQRAYWAAVRRDLLDKRTLINSVRSELRTDDCENVRTWSEHVSDVRLHDVLAWADPTNSPTVTSAPAKTGAPLTVALAGASLKP